jgi:hypothetical protein
MEEFLILDNNSEILREEGISLEIPASINFNWNTKNSNFHLKV